MSVDPTTYRKIMECYHGKCTECGGSVNVELHHRLPDYDRHAKAYPLFIDSPFNLIPLCGTLARACHVNEKHKYTISPREAQMYEDYLRELLVEEQC